MLRIIGAQTLISAPVDIHPEHLPQVLLDGVAGAGAGGPQAQDEGAGAGSVRQSHSLIRAVGFRLIPMFEQWLKTRK